MDLDGLPDFIKPKLRMFLSVDIVGSTAAKQKEHNFFKHDAQKGERLEDDGDDVEAEYNTLSRWLKTSIVFYELFGKEFGKAWQAVTVEAKKFPFANEAEFAGSTPKFWKAAGDEILFYKEISDWIQVPLTIGAWVMAMKAIRSTIKDAFGPGAMALDVKGAAWIAGFPVVNTALSVAPSPAEQDNLLGQNIDAEFGKNPVCKNLLYTARLFGEPTVSKTFNDHANGHVDDQHVDFIGPLIDLGFRISQHADHQRMALSMEVVHAMIQAAQQHEGYFDSDGKVIAFNKTKSILNKFPSQYLHYAGRSPLKGIADPGGYPMFYIDVGLEDEIFTAESKLRIDGSRAMAPNDRDLSRFCHEYFCDHSVFAWPYLVKPDGNVVSDNSEDAGTYSAHIQRVIRAHQDRLNKLKQLWSTTFSLLEKATQKLEQSKDMPEENTGESVDMSAVFQKMPAVQAASGMGAKGEFGSSKKP